MSPYDANDSSIKVGLSFIQIFLQSYMTWMKTQEAPLEHLHSTRLI